MKLKRVLGKLSRQPYYAFWKLVEKVFYQGHEYTLSVPSGHLVYTPWYKDPEFSRIIRMVRASGPLIMSLDRCYVLYQFARYALNVPGQFAECGTYVGGTAHLISLVMKSKEEMREFHLFDTFTGMPDLAIPERDVHSPGDFGDTSLEYVQNRLKTFEFIRFHPGLIPATFSEITDVQLFAFVHVDVDIYPTAFECCQWFWPRLSPGGVIIFDDYGFYSYRRAIKAAVDEYFSKIGLRPIVLPTAQALVIKPYKV